MALRSASAKQQNLAFEMQLPHTWAMLLHLVQLPAQLRLAARWEQLAGTLVAQRSRRGACWWKKMQGVSQLPTAAVGMQRWAVPSTVRRLDAMPMPFSMKSPPYNLPS